jgi:hypothetical protein
MHCALPPFEPPDGVQQRRLALAIVGGARPRGDRYLSAIARLQGFSSCSPAAFPHQWAVWWGEASRVAASAPPSASRIFVIRAEAEERTEWGLPPRAPVTLFFPQRLGEKGILQPCGGFLQPCGGRRNAAPWTGCSFLSFVWAAVVPRAGRPRPGPPCTVSRAGDRPPRRTPRGRCSCSGVASARTGVKTCRCALGRPLFTGAVSVGSNPQPAPSDSSALAACPRPSCGDVGEGLFTAAFVLRSSLLLFSRPRWRSLSLLLGRRQAARSSSSRGPPGMEVVHTRGSGIGVPFVRRYTGFLPEQNVTASST